MYDEIYTESVRLEYESTYNIDSCKFGVIFTEAEDANPLNAEKKRNIFARFGDLVIKALKFLKDTTLKLFNTVFGTKEKAEINKSVMIAKTALAKEPAAKDKAIKVLSSGITPEDVHNMDKFFDSIRDSLTDDEKNAAKSVTELVSIVEENEKLLEKLRKGGDVAKPLTIPEILSQLDIVTEQIKMAQLLSQKCEKTIEIQQKKISEYADDTGTDDLKDLKVTMASNRVKASTIIAKNCAQLNAKLVEDQKRLSNALMQIARSTSGE